ncbi:hypothetical protein ED28_01170 [[Pantoea] beijingensis]|uniref:Virulence factor n=1 Tax=[Pantoea] beijingensis TaxID=1324864 RepID=A0A443IHT7_9GAMM|nr:MULTISPECIES: virulence factor SrfC family protein [Erwiniaceae]RWR03627.1 hypothetical protein ED28_01170 [[Pantoea] beijingensis]
MTDTSVEQQLNQSQQRLQAVNLGIGQAIDWVDNMRHAHPRLDIEADQLNIALRRGRSHAQHLARSLANANTLAFYGLSQQGKAGLINAMIADASGRLETLLAGKKFDYFTHINPGNRDCGFAIRFTHQAGAADSRWPVELRLLSEADITVMITMLWLQTASSFPDEQHIRAQLQILMRHRQLEPVAGLTRDETIELWDYLQRHDRDRQKALRHSFWPTVIKLAPMLTIDDRARLFSLLWQENVELTALWRQLVHRRHSLGACRVLAPLTLLVGDTWLPADTLLTPAAAAGLNTEYDVQVQVCPRYPDGIANPLSMSLAELALLTAELTLPLCSTPQVPLFEQTDVLDIPGVGEPIDNAVEQVQMHSLGSQLLRVKRAYLLEWYAVRQQIERLLVCCAAVQRAEVKSVSQRLDFWQKKTRGAASPEKRQSPALLWVITSGDRRHSRQKNGDHAVQRQVGGPGETWGTLLAHDTGSLQRMVDWLATEMQHENKLQRIDEQLKELQRNLVDNLLACWRSDRAIDHRHTRQHIADTVIKALQSRTGLHGELLERLQPSREVLRELYSSPPLPLDPLPLSGIESDRFREVITPPLSEARVHSSLNHERQFAERVEHYWINYLRALPEQDALLALLGINKITLEHLVNELICAFYRLNIDTLLRSKVMQNPTSHGHPNAPRDRQVARAIAVLGDFVSWLGFLQMDEAQRPDSRINHGKKIFTQSSGAAREGEVFQQLTRLPAATVSGNVYYIYDWLTGLYNLIIQNEGHTPALTFDEVTHQQLAKIVKQMTF